MNAKATNKKRKGSGFGKRHLSKADKKAMRESKEAKRAAKELEEDDTEAKIAKKNDL